MSAGGWLLFGGVLGYVLGALTFRDEATFWKSRADYWYENSTAWMRAALRCCPPNMPRSGLVSHHREDERA